MFCDVAVACNSNFHNLSSLCRLVVSTTSPDIEVSVVMIIILNKNKTELMITSMKQKETGPFFSGNNGKGNGLLVVCV